MLARDCRLRAAGAARVLLRLLRAAVENLRECVVLEHRHDREMHEVAPHQRELRKRLRIASAKLKANGMLEWIEGKKTPAIAMQHSTRREHLRVDQRMPC